MKLYLASESPRRKELLTQLGFAFESVKIDCDETYPSDVSIDEVAAYVAKLKSKNFRELQVDEVLLTADTIVVLGDEILGKPKNKEDAKKMLQSLSGKKHQVYTAICIRTREKSYIQTDKAIIEFSEISDEEIDFYIDNFHPLDKAGSYGIQEWLGMAKIKKIEGSFYTIMGLPTHLVYDILKNRI